MAGQMAAAASLPTVSGLAVGIDTAGHRGSLAGGGATVAILGSGIDSITPRGNVALAHEIVDRGGCIISECLPGTAPSAATLVARNRLQAALGSRLIMVQCGIPSGTLHTVRFAFELGRRIAVPVPPAGDPAPENAGNAALTDPAGMEASIIGSRERGRWHMQDRKPFADDVLRDKAELEAFIRGSS
jgi:DNA processing protein